VSRAIESDWYESIKDIDRPNGIGVLIIKNYINVEFPVLPIGTKVWDSTNKAWWEKVALCDQGTSFHQWKIGKNEVGFISVFLNIIVRFKQKNKLKGEFSK
jgi:hypothetical protein